MDSTTSKGAVSSPDAVDMLTTYSVHNDTNYSAWLQNSTESYKETDGVSKLNWAVLPIIAIIILVAMGNVLVIVSVCLDRKLRSATNCFLSSLAVADLLVALTVMPPSLAMIVNNYVWPFSDELCGIWTMLDVFFSTSSILHLCMISLDRYMALARPFHHSHRSGGTGSARLGGFHFAVDDRSKKLKRVATRILLVWTVALGLAIPLPIVARRHREYIFVEDMCAINLPWFQIFGSFVAFFLPLVIMFVMYTLTIRTLRQQAQLVSSMMVQNSCKNSPLYHSRKASTRRAAASRQQNAEDDCTKCVYTSSQFQRRESTAALEEVSGGSVTESLRSMLLSRQMSTKRGKCETCGCSQEKTSEERISWARVAVRPVAKALRQMQNMIRFGGIVAGTRRQEAKTTDSTKDKKCTRKKGVPADTNNATERKSNIFPRKYRSSVRRMSSSFKNRAMASITNEQRASKVLGLIFVLFCVFWCPFFITNVVSRLCTTCDQNLMGECMNWFVWVGYVSSGVNPCVYTLFSSRFRDTFSKLIKGDISGIKQRKLARSFSSRDTSGASLRSGSGITRRSSKGSIRPATAAAKNGARRANSPHVNEEETWLNNVKSAQSMKPTIPTHTRRDNSSESVTVKLWRSSWHAASVGGHVAIGSQSECLSSKSSQSLITESTNKAVGKRLKRPHSESDANSKQDRVEKFEFAPVIAEAGETEFTGLREAQDKTWLAKGEEYASDGMSSSSLESVWSQSQQSERSSSGDSQKDVTATTGDAQNDEVAVKETEFDANVAESAEHDVSTCECSLPAYEDFVRYRDNPDQFASKSMDNFKPQPATTSELQRERSFSIRKERLTREDSGMGASFDTLPHNLLPS